MSILQALTKVVNRFTIELMPFLKVLRSWIIDHRKTTNYELRSQSCKPKGFTLIELLIVIAIIGILASLGTVSYTSAQKKARDSQRKNDYKQIKTALHSYTGDNAGLFPAAASDSRNADWFDAIEPYFPGGSVPKDPKNGGTTYHHYLPQADGSYEFHFSTENLGDSSLPPECTPTRNWNGVDRWVCKS